MAEYDNIQLYSNYQSYYKRNKVNDNSLVSDTKSTRKKINHNCDNEIITSLAHKRPKTSYCSFTMTTKNKRNNNIYHNDEIINNSNTRNYMHKSATTALLSDSTKSPLEADCQLLITDRNNITDKNMCCTKTIILSPTKCIDNYNNNDNTKTCKFSIKRHFSCYNKSNNLLTLALLLIIGLMFKVNLCCGFQLTGSENSYAMFRKWYAGLNGSLELEFKTEQPNGLLLYTDDGGTYDFFELKLVEGTLRLRYNLGGGAQIISVGRDLHDGHWHKVQVTF